MAAERVPADHGAAMYRGAFNPAIVRVDRRPGSPLGPPAGLHPASLPLDHRPGSPLGPPAGLHPVTNDLTDINDAVPLNTNT